MSGSFATWPTCRALPQGVGRGEADNFLTDVGTQLRNSGLVGLRLRDDSLHERREQFGVLVRQAGERFDRDGIEQSSSLTGSTTCLAKSGRPIRF